MAKLSYWNFPAEWVPLIEKILMWNDRFLSVSVRQKRLFTSVKRKAGLTQASLQPLAASHWASLTQGERDNWASAASVSAQYSFQLFLQDVAARVKNELPEVGTPSDVVQYLCGRAVFTFPSAGFLLAQAHPYMYHVLRKVTGSRNSYEPVELIESFNLPMQFGLSYKTDLSSVGASPLARFYIEVVSHYQGRDIVTLDSINMPLTSAWTRETKTLTGVLGKPKSYTAYLDVQDCNGTMDWDNLLLFHSGQNWARDFRCNNVGASFTRSFYQVARNWEPLIQPPGAFYDSIYHQL